MHGDAMTKRRIAHVTLGLEVGGQERLLVEMARHRDVSRFDWTVIVLGPRGSLADAIESAGVRMMALESADGISARTVAASCRIVPPGKIRRDSHAR